MRTSRLVLVVAAVSTWASACGEDVDFVTGASDAGAPDAAVAGPDASPAPPSATRDAMPGAPGPVGMGDDASFPNPFGCPPGFDGGAPACRENGTLCHSTRDCCSGRCEQGYCLPSGTCSAPGVACSMRGSCCSGRCEPTGRSGALACSQYCQADGTRCDDPSQCCSLGCNQGTCGGPLCVTAGDACMSDSQCCSGRCGGGQCIPMPGACLPTGEGCGADGGMTCCSNFCDTRTGRCDLGLGGCRESSSPCNVDSDCCRGQCLRNAQGIDVCTAPCLADGQDCNSNGDCCDGVCSGSPSRCGALPPTCP